MKLIISVREARKLLGAEDREMTDEQVSDLVEQTNELAKLALDVARCKIVREKSDEKQYRTTDTGQSNPKSNT